MTDDAPVSGATLFTPYLAPDELDDGHYRNNSYITEDDECDKSGGPTCQRFTGKYKDPTEHRAGKAPNYNCPPNPVTALTDVKSTVTSAISALAPDGYTVIPAGLLWGWRVLSPGEPFTEGVAYDREDTTKVIVLLTDGENDVKGGGSRRTGHNNSLYNAFGYAGMGHLGATSGNGAEDELDAKTATVCSAIKARGIQIYTIGFQITSPSSTANMLKACATEPEMAYLSTNAQLATIFDSIAKGLSDLRIAQ